MASGLEDVCAVVDAPAQGDVAVHGDVGPVDPTAAHRDVVVHHEEHVTGTDAVRVDDRIAARRHIAEYHAADADDVEVARSAVELERAATLQRQAGHVDHVRATRREDVVNVAVTEVDRAQALGRAQYTHLSECSGQIR